MSSTTTTAPRLYEVVADEVRVGASGEVRRSPWSQPSDAAAAGSGNSNRTAADLVFRKGDVVSIDFVEDITSGGGVALRLSDGSGWVREKQQQGSLEEVVQLRPLSEDRILRPATTGGGGGGLVAVYVDGAYDSGSNRAADGEEGIGRSLLLLRHPISSERRDDDDEYGRFLVEPAPRYVPFQKLYSDLQVTSTAATTTTAAAAASDRGNDHGSSVVTFYRIQGTNSWIPDKRRKRRQSRRHQQQRPISGSYYYYSLGNLNKPNFGNDDDDDMETVLLREDQIEIAAANDGDNRDKVPRFFAYVALRSLEIRSSPDVGEASRTGIMLERGDIALVNIVRQSPCPANGNGPFLHLLPMTDDNDDDTTGNGSGGWVFERKHYDRIMERIDMERGDWTWSPNPDVPIASFLRSSFRRNASVLRTDISVGTSSSGGPYGSSGQRQLPQQSNSLSALRCDVRVESPITGAYFYLIVTGSDNDSYDSSCWVCDRTMGDRDPTLLVPAPPLGLTSMPSRSDNGDGEDDGWSPDFVRGLAAAVTDLVEIGADPDQHEVSFKSSDGTEIRVNCRTKTVTTAESHSTSPYRSKIQHLFSPFPEQRQQYQSAQQKAQRSRAIASPEQLAEILADPNSISSRFGDGFVGGGGILLGSREGQKVTYDPLAQPDSDIDETGLNTPKRSGGTKHSSTQDGPYPGESEILVRRQFFESEQELARVQERQARLLQLIRAYDEKNSMAAARLLGRRQPSAAAERIEQQQQPHEELRSEQADTSIVPIATNGTSPARSGEEKKQETGENSDRDSGEVSSLGEQINRTCGVCGADFPSARVRSLHW